MKDTARTVTPVTPDGTVTQLSLGVTDVTDVTERCPSAPNARARGVKGASRTPRTHGIQRFSPVTPVTPVTPSQACDRCRADETAPPCDGCPLYGAWLDRIGCPDDAGWREAYADWAADGGWEALWEANRARRRAADEERVREVIARFPRVLERWPSYPSALGAR